MGWNYLSIPKLQRLCRWSLEMDKQFPPPLYNGCNYLLASYRTIHLLTSLQNLSSNKEASTRVNVTTKVNMLIKYGRLQYTYRVPCRCDRYIPISHSGQIYHEIKSHYQVKTRELYRIHYVICVLENCTTKLLVTFGHEETSIITYIYSQFLHHYTSTLHSFSWIVDFL